jgi:glucose-6-phosphate isomerase
VLAGSTNRCTSRSSWEISRYAESQHDAVDAVVLMGMGGSSLAPEVLRRTFGVDWFHVLDTTHPKAIHSRS